MLVSVILAGLLVFFPFAALAYERRSADRRAAAAHHEAAAVGLTTARVEREMPVFERGDTRVRFAPGSCARSIMPLRGSRGPAKWSLKVTDRRGGMAGNGWWHLREEDGELPAAVVTRLSREIERLEYDGGFLEFAGSEHAVIAWWDDTLGPDEARRVAAVLADVVSLLEVEAVPARSRLHA